MGEAAANDDNEAGVEGTIDACGVGDPAMREVGAGDS